MKHTPVLLQEVIEGLSPKDGDIYLDCTLGFGGHAKAMFETGKKIKIVGMDLDEDAISHTETLLNGIGADYSINNESFRNLDKVVEEQELSCVDKILFDLGVSSHHIDSSGRGFTFQKDEPLEMTMSKNPEEAEFTAYTIVNDWDEENIADIIYGYGEERYSRRIAKAIVEARENSPIETTFALRDVITKAIPRFARSGKINPATKTFQALRIAVNDELGALRDGLKKASKKLCIGGRVAVISFHSLEDRIVKRYFRELEKSGVGKNLYKKPIVPTEDEIKLNPRARSAKLRVFEKMQEII